MFNHLIYTAYYQIVFKLLLYFSNFKSGRCNNLERYHWQGHKNAQKITQLKLLYLQLYSIYLYIIILSQLLQILLQFLSNRLVYNSCWMLTTSSAQFISKELDIVEHKKKFMNLMMCSFEVAVSLAMVCARGIYTFYMCIL